MPELKQIEASLELGTSNTKLKEYGARYSDGHVETFIAVPDTDMPFSIHLTTKHYIAPGISFFVFMDGEYQCNRNKIGLKLPRDGVHPNEYETEFRMRQKEEKTSAGTFVAREWSFAKLNTVAADKAPSLNPDFVRNVGTIEIVAMRCRPASDDVPQPQTSSSCRKPDVTSQKAPSKTSKTKPAKQPTPAPSKAPSKPASAANEDIFGDLMGLFDGACDNMGLDGASDERPVFGDGRVNAQPPPGSYRDSNRGDFRRENQYSPTVPDNFPTTPADIHVGGPERAKAFVAKAMEEAQAAQLDGQTDWLASYSDVYPRQQQDDLRGDKYLGMTGRDRSDYKQFFRERGDPVSQSAKPAIGDSHMEGFICNTVAAADQIKSAPPIAKSSARFFAASQNKGYYDNTSDGLRLFAEDLEEIRQDLAEQNEKNPRLDTTDAWRDWRLLQAKLQSMRAERPGGQSQHGRFPNPPAASQSPQQEALEDIVILRVELRIASQLHSTLDTDTWFAELSAAENRYRNDKFWFSQTYPDESAYLLARRAQLSERKQLMTKVIKDLHRFDSNFTSKVLEDRVSTIREEGVMVHARLKELSIRTSASQMVGTPASARRVNFQQGHDGAPQQQATNPAMPGKQSFWNDAATKNDQDWQQVGGGSWKPDQQAGQGWPSKQPSTHDHFPNEGLITANNWNRSSQRPTSGYGGGAANTRANPQHNNNAPSQASGKRDSQHGWDKSAQHQQDGAEWSNGQQDNNAWQPSKPASQHASAAGWGADRSSQRSKAGWNDGSQRSSQNDGGGDNWNNEGTGGNGLGAQSGKPESNSGRWGRQSNANGSKFGGRSVTRESTASNPKELIKPYWKDWDKAATPGTGETGRAARKRETAGPVYTYPAAKLPAIPEGKAASATHGIQTGRGAEYNHLCRRPIYIDTMEKPYAVFSFKYRSKEKLKQITGLNVKSVDEDVKAVQKQAQKDKLMQMPKDELIEQLMKSSASKSESRKAQSASCGSGWGNKPASNADGEDKRSKAGSAAGSGWGANNINGQTGGGADGWGGSNHSKSKQSDANGWGGTQEHWKGGGSGRWDGQDDFQDSATAKDNAKDDGPGAPVPGEFKWPYDAFRIPEDQPAASNAPPAAGEYIRGYDAVCIPENEPAAANAPPGHKWEQETKESIFEAPDGIIYRGQDVIGYKPWAGSDVKRHVDAKKHGGGFNGA